MSENEEIRAFLAIPTDGLWVESARGLVARLKEALPRASWTKPETWHMTLKFFERISPENVRSLAAAVGPLAAATVPGEMRAARAIVFPARGPARVLGVGFEQTPALEEVSRLAEEANTQAKKLGLQGEGRPFHPHVTLVRLRRPWPPGAVETFRSEVEAWNFPPWQARSCVFYESRLMREGAVHTPLEEWSFVGGPRGVRA